MLLAIDKPTWITSYDVIRRLKRAFPKEKIWHSGTLDPLATGLLIIWVGKWTKLLTQIQWLDKKYETIIDFSQMSDTRDVDYRKQHEKYEFTKDWITKNTQFIAAPSQLEIEEKLSSLVPEKELPLTPFSAKKIDWKKMYELARNGQVLTEKRIMKTFESKVISYNFPLLELYLHVWSGTYIRSIWYWLGQEFWLGWILTQLRRTAIGKYNLNEMKIEKIGDEWLMGCEIFL
jgi:tRNA pseudouridine55 synthase